jgi:hypothetical protein
MEEQMLKAQWVINDSLSLLNFFFPSFLLGSILCGEMRCAVRWIPWIGELGELRNSEFVEFWKFVWQLEHVDIQMSIVRAMAPIQWH